MRKSRVWLRVLAGSRYTVTLAKLDAARGSVELTFAPGDKKVVLLLQKPQTIDVDGDRKDDVQATLSAIVGNKATIAFREVATITKNPNPQTDTPSNKTGLGRWLVVAGVAVLVLGLYWLMHARRSRNTQ